MARTGYFFQQARGRALVRSKQMQKARAAKRSIERGSVYTGTLAHPLTPSEIMNLKNTIRWCVRRAREANRDWRKYRKLYEQLERDL